MSKSLKSLNYIEFSLVVLLGEDELTPVASIIFLLSKGVLVNTDS